MRQDVNLSSSILLVVSRLAVKRGMLSSVSSMRWALFDRSGWYSPAANMFWHSVGVTMSMMRADFFRNSALILASRFSMGLKSVLWDGR